MLKFQWIILFLCLFEWSFGQFSIYGTVQDEQLNPIEFVMVVAKLDTSVITTTVTDSLGNFQISHLKEGTYDLYFNDVAHKDTSLSLSLNKDIHLNLQYKHSLESSGIVISAAKPLLQRKIDRFRFNVANTDIVFGSNVWEVISKTPLVNTTEQGGISISSTNGAIVYINNKKKLLSGEALMNYLRSIPSENIEAVEVITTPPAKYEAEGGAGIINIVMKKSKEDGLIGNTSIKSSQATFLSPSGSLYLNYRKNKWDIYTDFSLGRKSLRTTYDKNIYFPANVYTLSNRVIHTLNTNHQADIGANMGVDYQINARHCVGLMLDYSGMLVKKIREAHSRDYYSAADSLSITNNTDNQTTHDYSINVNYEGTLDSLGKKININGDALDYIDINQSISNTSMLSEQTGDILYNRSLFRSKSPQHIRNQSAKIDFECPFNDKLSLETGLKTTFSTINNDLVFENKLGAIWQKDTFRSNLFVYKENIHSAYALINHELNDKWAYQMGLRIENTIATGFLNGNKVVNRNYTNLFPTAFLKYIPKEGHNFVFAVTSRITRPSFWDVNPFRLYTTDKAYLEGNPYLLPAKYYKQELTYTLKNTYIFQTACSQLLNEFYALPYNPSGELIANRKINYGNKYTFLGTFTFSKQLYTWWKLTSSITTAYILSKGKYADVVIDNRSLYLNISANQSFTISKKRGLTCSLIANNTFPVTIVNTRIGNRLVTELRVRKSLKEGKWNITLAARDLFKSNQDRYNIDLNGFNIIDKNYHDTRSVSLALSYQFGKSTVKDSRERDTGNSAEKQRL